MSEHPPASGRTRRRPSVFLHALDWLVAHGTVVYWALWIICALLAAADFFYVKKVHFALEAVPAAYGAIGFLAPTLIVLLAWPFRRLVMRAEDYYRVRGERDENVR